MLEGYEGGKIVKKVVSKVVIKFVEASSREYLYKTIDTYTQRRYKQTQTHIHVSVSLFIIFV